MNLRLFLFIVRQHISGYYFAYVFIRRGFEFIRMIQPQRPTIYTTKIYKIIDGSHKKESYGIAIKMMYTYNVYMVHLPTKRTMTKSLTGYCICEK